MVWFSVIVSVCVCCRSFIVVISPWSVVLNSMVRVGVKVWCIGLAVVSAFMVNVGVISMV